MNREQGLALIEQTRIIAIIRGVEETHMDRLADALYDGGIKAMEVTLNTPGALDIIPRLQDRVGERMYIGAGTVIDLDDAKKAIAAGAAYLVTPNTDEDVIRYGVEQGVPVFPGAMTPSEIVKAWKAGATAVKIFPGASLGIGYLKELQGPLSHIPMVAVGGVNEENIRQFLDAGCYGFGIGGSLVNLKEIHSGNYSWVTDKAKRLIERMG
ncbi:bifunctional 4-hydroxy-2-oxoglutarate aldolase/2-dehydro-3-deoxy-phosphogluconate aldolase [Paenibacillus validus]|uniref:Bifunctional 4-hydroxy-2-oxoglutarate aldolase/2-dehydro-3-deoxy-phosphogluconate aldolase n=1 Tax=Paenibacillus validus TaxID=44253 RepID=A0A7X2ZA27_9BACL|nr:MULTISPECIES: bifunctional 4-hydroxy-2-oxoglutarate aldolase/2-dehydro-3-deoxy-phosphogluconate aldolase [Paenibacillus]MED4600492.1 bifunctional 4-hydroxy-2-oxoglutarate aldolase/2-dehydro-3-deoxy-phosphogluconate aldolase [Paenibacillus validus]MED4604751.1 bifunctional 4-hydroxy-2-oxoglutarate aldolase/2-dehydro-3-deoxy-phosphogluconate aldolase [Paenibacillus validus]MUG71027.1 bifunctional 4-hydroxy-2-oxoglutarate aldolase/2-dehydro-3-deoxy-phosphogluconate aldolase [Paenibacillus validu